MLGVRVGLLVNGVELGLKEGCVVGNVDGKYEGATDDGDHDGDVVTGCKLGTIDNVGVHDGDIEVREGHRVNSDIDG